MATFRFSTVLAAHRFSYLAAEHVDPEDLGIVVALSEGEAVALRCAVVAAHTEENLVDWVVGNLRVGIGVQEPVCNKTHHWFGLLKLHKNFPTRNVSLPPPSYLTVPSDTPGTDSVTSRGTWHCPRRMLIMRSASTSLRGALTEAQPR